MNKAEVGFAPENPTDGRPLGSWETRYDKKAVRHIRLEAAYLAGLLFAVPVLSLLCWAAPDLAPPEYDRWRLPIVSLHALGWLGGTLGGVLFSTKWLYHTVAKNTWNLDRRLWRVLTPHLSGGLAFAFLLLARSDLVTLINGEALQSPSAVFGAGFLVGYFSDSAVAKLSEVAETLFGATERHAGGAERSEPPAK